MADTNGLMTLFRETEREYVEDFCSAYKDEIVTPDGFVVFCKYLEKTATHICRGKEGETFSKTRATRILWSKYILMNPKERTVLVDTETSNLVFFFTRKKLSHAVICRELDDKLNLISAFPVSGERAKKYREGKPPYEFYQ